MKKIGLFGGTFDPIHNGHLIIAEYIWDELSLDEVWFIPAKIHPLKKNEEITSQEHRLQMLHLAVESNDHFKICDLEIRREGKSYTVDTIRELKKQFMKHKPEYYFLMGMDNVNDLHRWKQPEKLLQLCKVVAFGRPGFKPDQKAQPFLPHIQFLHVPLLQISATFIRQRLHEGHTVRYFIPAEIFSYIQEKQLYK